MAFDRASLALQGSGAFAKCWTYESADAASDVCADDYFLDAYRDLKLGDVIFITASNGEEDPADIEFIVAMVRESTSGTVVVACSELFVAFADLPSQNP